MPACVEDFVKVVLDYDGFLVVIFGKVAVWFGVDRLLRCEVRPLFSV